ncbi:hypothetical protein ACIBBE_24910 [Streptomyces sp. NPDC051644]|uniref:hypothetical protein n=1 Tax=Streptomyces sp. NPDC051644 TaxID=3365666 RepID=UPI0037BC0703
MSADYVPSPAEAGEIEPTASAALVHADYADWSLITSVDESRPFPTLVLGNDRLELHLELGPERLDELLAELAAQIQDSGDVDLDYLEPDDAERKPLGRRIGGKAVRASGWPTADRWWRSTESSTRIIVAGIIAAVMVLGLLVTF